MQLEDTLKNTKEMNAGLQQQETPTKVNPELHIDLELHLKPKVINQTHCIWTVIYTNKHYLRNKEIFPWIQQWTRDST